MIIIFMFSFGAKKNNCVSSSLLANNISELRKPKRNTMSLEDLLAKMS